MDLLSRISALAADPSPKAVATLRYFQAVLDGEAVIPGGIKMLMAELACDGFASPEIDDAHFPGADAFVSIDDVVLVDIGRDWTVPEMVAYLDAMVPPMTPTMPDKGIRSVVESPGVLEGGSLVILGQKCRGSKADHVIVLCVCEGRRRAYLDDAGDTFPRSARVPAEPKRG